MTQVIQLVIEPPKLRQARNLTLAIINLAQKGTLTPEQYQARIETVGILAQEAHDVIVAAECENQHETCKHGDTEGRHTAS
ncbi:hypothetical protein [Pantoea septica]|uniref:hypothetical protein n=1 Tax=Pantoea septica TaxID=472695 RepID=UPI00289DA1BE|nr:hypothetical protein [Pantoea septica]